MCKTANFIMRVRVPLKSLNNKKWKRKKFESLVEEISKERDVPSTKLTEHYTNSN